MLCLEGLFSMLDGTRGKADRTFFNCYHCRMRSGGTDTSKIMQPLEGVERAVDRFCDWCATGGDISLEDSDFFFAWPNLVT